MHGIAEALTQGRRTKQLCSIPVAAEPCVNCRTRSRPCTFDIPPTARKRRSEGRRSSPSASSAPSAPPVPDVRLPPIPAPVPPPHSECTNAAPAVPTSTAESAGQLQPLSSRMQPSGERTQDDEHPGSLELDDADDEESHFVGTGVFSSLTLPSAHIAASSAFTREGSLAFRQVSSDERHPAYFIKHPSFLYGRAPSSGADAYRQVCALCAPFPGTVEKAIDLLIRNTLPAFPFINVPRLLASSRTTPRYALLAGIVAHCTSYIPEIKHLRKQLWAQALLGLEDEYRQPRLRTLQLAILVLCSRPSENAGQCEIGLGRVSKPERTAPSQICDLVAAGGHLVLR